MTLFWGPCCPDISARGRGKGLKGLKDKGLKGKGFKGDKGDKGDKGIKDWGEGKEKERGKGMGFLCLGVLSWKLSKKLIKVAKG